MSDVSSREPSWKKFENHQGPSAKEEHDALQAWNLKKIELAGGRPGRAVAMSPTFGLPRQLKRSG